MKIGPSGSPGFGPDIEASRTNLEVSNWRNERQSPVQTDSNRAAFLFQKNTVLDLSHQTRSIAGKVRVICRPERTSLTTPGARNVMAISSNPVDSVSP